MAGVVLIGLAFLLDLAVGDPRGIVHPVVVMGRLISLLEKLLYNPNLRPIALFFRGALVTLIIVSGSYVLFACLSFFASPTPWLWWILNVWFGASTLAGTSLAAAGMAVYTPLFRGDLSEARTALAKIVSRDCDNLAPPDIARGAVETVAENTSDGVVAPLFFLAIGGVPLAMAYKAVNTLDSMLGYKNDKYLWFGRASARLDDAANWIPARLTALLMIAAAAMSGRDWRRAWRILLRDGAKHPSPNSGRPEAAVAGALGIVLGGENSYQGRTSFRPRLGDGDNPLVSEHINQAVRIMRITDFLTTLLLMAGRMVLIWLF
jgi:adenosylcobinamide-phosphate synthase